jgi:3'(2'), 5'-bisphosphate nucleotidase
VVSEESALPSEEEARAWGRFFVVDPLDGTKDFVANTGEFSINLALIEGQRPVIGVVAAPALGTIWYAQRGIGAFRRTRNDPATRIRSARRATEDRIGLESRFHTAPATRELYAALGITHVIACGSAIKLARIAEGSADIYYCPHPTREWDTAAGQLLVMEASGAVVAMPERSELRYNKTDFLNPPYLAAGDPTLTAR